MLTRFSSTLTIIITAALLGFCLNAANAQQAREPKPPAAKHEAAKPQKPEEQSVTDTAAPEEKLEGGKQPQKEPVPPEKPAGIYLSIRWLIVLFVSCLLWVFLADWLNRDAHGIELRREWWNLLMFCAGAVGILMFWFGHVGFSCAPVVLGVLVCILYVPVRNKHVNASRRIWTREHIRLKLIAALRRVGIRVNTRTFLRGKVPGQEIRLLGADGQPLGIPDIEGGKAKAEEGISCIKEIMDGAIHRKATEVELQPRGEMLRVRYQIDGFFYDGPSYSWQLSAPILLCAKSISGIDAPDRNRAHVGAFAVGLADRTVAVRSSVDLSVQGETIYLRLRDPARALFKLEKIGLSEDALKTLRELLQCKGGLIFVCSPKEGGATTTLYSMIGEIHPEKRSVVTIEQPIEYRLKNVTQLPVNPNRDQPFPKVFQAAAERKPDVLVIGDLDGKQGVQAALIEANQGTLVLASVRADSALQGLRKLFDWGGDPKLIGRALRAVLAQRLVRRLCTSCREAFKPSEELLKKINVTPEAAEKLFKAAGCEKCMKTGFFGRTGIFELLEATDSIRTMIARGASVAEILGEAQRSGHGHIWDDGITKVLSGETTIQELIRVTKSK